MSAAPGPVRISSYVLLCRDTSLLLCRLSAQVPGSAGRWTLPGGGIDFGEHPEQAAIRETFEETGLRIAIAEVAFVDSEVFRFSSGPSQAIRIVYWGRLIGGSLRNEANGSTDLCKWIPFSEVETTPMVSLARRAMDYLNDSVSVAR
jgi:ADP-ribose pyrophosphatase YjhB (NUDIX family)